MSISTTPPEYKESRTAPQNRAQKRRAPEGTRLVMPRSVS